MCFDQLFVGERRSEVVVARAQQLARLRGDRCRQPIIRGTSAPLGTKGTRAARFVGLAQPLNLPQREVEQVGSLGERVAADSLNDFEA
jgi:hypothetical protein